MRDATGGPGNRGLTLLDRIEEARLLVGGEEGSAESQPPDPSHRLPPPVPAARTGADNGRCVGVAARRVTEGLAERVPAVGLAAVAGGGHVASPESRVVRSTGRTARFNSFADQFGYRVPPRSLRKHIITPSMEIFSSAPPDQLGCPR